MKFKKITAACMAACVSACSLLPLSASAETELAPVDPPEPVYNEEGYDISGFAYRFPEKFSKDDTVTVTENSYQSHNVSISITEHDSDRMTGDLDESGGINVQDAVMLCRVLAEDTGLDISETGKLNADINEDNLWNMEDLSRMLKYLAELLPESEFFVDHTLVYFVVDVYVRDINSFRGGFAGGEYTLPSNAITEEVLDMANAHNALFAINCDYVAHRTNGITYRNGIMYREDASTYKKDVCVIYKDGVMDILTDKEYRNLTDGQKANIWQTSAFAPGLVKDGAAASGMTGQLAQLHPRSGIGYYEPGHYVFVQVEGRQKGYSAGITLDDYAKLFYDLGVTEAFNLDGGSSSVITFMGKEANRPAWSGRKSSDILYICELSQIPFDTAAATFLAEQEAAAETTAPAP
ncbi:MAG: phosphodiester glycosidase family protein [Oscillospiraceae bacterium]|nr:phosphodiester glycosidase family protein [Oscillospiraceae bacterium]